MEAEGLPRLTKTELLFRQALRNNARARESAEADQREASANLALANLALETSKLEREDLLKSAAALGFDVTKISGAEE